MTADLVRPRASVSADGRVKGVRTEEIDQIGMNTVTGGSEEGRLQYDPGEHGQGDQGQLVREQLIFAAAADHRRSVVLPTTACDPEFTYGMVKLAGDVCFGCGGYILDRYLLQVGDQIWHADCLRCSACGLSLEQLPSCYVRDERIHCKTCYQRHFGVKCARCGRTIQPTDWVRRARQFVYHLACFACDSCKRQLSTGEEFALQESSVLCKQHYMELLEGDSGKAQTKQKTKRVRTTFSEEQLQILQANFQVDSNPDGQDLERIAQMTGLSKRVTQVWFQNSRARQKKYQGMKMKNLPPSSAGSNSAIAASSSCSHENSIEVDCDEDECESMSCRSSPSPRQSNPQSSAMVNVNFMASENQAVQLLLSNDEQHSPADMVNTVRSNTYPRF